MTSPLPLDSPRWSELSHAYGVSSDIPDLLIDLKEKSGLQDPQTEPLFTLWSSLYHQEDVFDASYAAFPHLVDIAAEKSGDDRVHVLFLAAAIAGAKSDPSECLHGDTRGAFFAYRPRALGLICECLAATEAPGDFQYWLGSIAAFKGKTAFARLMFSFDCHIDAVLEAGMSFPVTDADLVELRA